MVTLFKWPEETENSATKGDKTEWCQCQNPCQIFSEVPCSWARAFLMFCRELLNYGFSLLHVVLIFHNIVFCILKCQGEDPVPSLLTHSLHRKPTEMHLTSFTSIYFKQANTVV